MLIDAGVKDRFQTPRGQHTRQQILDFAVDVASAEGLEGLTVGRLSQELGMSKSGLFAHFGSKEELQLATVDAARVVFEAKVLPPSQAAAEGLARLCAMLSAWTNYVRNNGLRGGCFFAAAATEFDGRPGRVRDQIAELSKAWLDLIEKEIRTAKRSGELNSQIEPAQLAFELHAFVQESNWKRQLFGDRRAFGRGTAAILRTLEAASTPSGKKTLGKLRPQVTRV